jgi:hypothetical protein
VGVWPHRLEAHLVACARELSQSWLGGLVAVGSPPATQPASTVPRRKTASTAKNDLVAIPLKRETSIQMTKRGFVEISCSNNDLKINRLLTFGTEHPILHEHPFIDQSET